MLQTGLSSHRGTEHASKLAFSWSLQSVFKYTFGRHYCWFFDDSVVQLDPYRDTVIDPTGRLYSTGRTLGPNRGVLGGSLVKQRCTLVDQNGIWDTQVHFCCDTGVKIKIETDSLRLRHMPG